MENPERSMKHIIPAQATRDGDGVNILRIAGKHLNTLLDPFLLVDQIQSDDSADYVGGFPEHPHRGFETLTYMLAGGFSHRDHLGNRGSVNAGGAQWMTAGRGIIHSEMPEPDGEHLHGFQLWMNLPATDKLCQPAWRDVPSSEVAHESLANGADFSVIAGKVTAFDDRRGFVTVKGPIQTVTDITVADLQLPAHTEINLSMHSDYMAAIWVLQGEVNGVLPNQLGVFDNGDTLRLTAAAMPSRVLLLSGRPLREPIAQYGPFVMNTADQVEQAIRDYQNGTLIHP